ncbi:MAG: hypothetical protein ACHQ1H_10555 [Nitrososphaerales archaeon]
MKAGPMLFRVTAAAVFIQLVLGGLLTFDFISAAPHIITGFIVFILAIVTMVLAITSKPVFKPIRMMSIILVVLLLVQILLGFATLGSGSQVLAWIHFVTAMAIYGLVVSGAVIAIRWDQMARAGTGNLEVGMKK